jgi:hypothetical protein
VVLLRRFRRDRLLDAGRRQGPAHRESSAGQPEPGLDGNGAGIIVVGGEATVDATDTDPREDKSYWDKYQADAKQFGLTDAMGAYDTRVRFTIDKVWTTPTEG